jgi:hypothetical protein
VKVLVADDHAIFRQTDSGAAEMPEANREFLNALQTWLRTPGPSAVLADELDACRFQCVANGLNHSLA